MRYIFRNIRNTAAKSPLLAFLLLLCLSVSTFVILYSHGTFQNYQTEKTIEDKKLPDDGTGGSAVTINFDENDISGCSTVGELRQVISMLSDETKENFTGFFFYVNPDRTQVPFWTEFIYDSYIERKEEFDRQAVESGDREQYYSDNGVDINAPWDPETDFSIMYPLLMFRLEYHKESGEYGVYSKYQQNQVITKGRAISEDEEINGADVAVLSDSAEQLIGSEIEVYGKTYTVIGTEGEMVTSILIPFKTMSDEGLISYIDIMFDNSILTTPVYNELRTAFDAVYGDRIEFPELETADVTEIHFYNSIMAIAVIIAVISAINLAILFRYILNTRRKALSIMRICGCTRNKARRMYVAEILLTSTAVYWICAGIYAKLILPKLTKFYEHIANVYSAKTYLVMFGIYIAAIYAAINIMTIIHLHSSPVSTLKERGK